MLPFEISGTVESEGVSKRTNCRSQKGQESISGDPRCGRWARLETRTNGLEGILSFPEMEKNLNL